MPEDKNPLESPSPNIPNSYFADNYFETYANQGYYESSFWDLKIIFGQLDQSLAGIVKVKKTVAITIPWAQAKLAAFYLKLQVAASELQNGKIAIRSDLLPPLAPELTPEQESDPLQKSIHETYKRLREEFLKEV